ncbi:MAG: beta-galactosidase [Acidimicrobiia bacterium]|nr:beta-galactosidase [Acidimicrobiia bacterium]
MADDAITPLRTRWADDLDHEAPWPEYPRPQLRRERWQNLNGRWAFAITNRDAPMPEHLPDTITVPFPVGSALSGVDHTVTADERVWMRRRFTPPLRHPGERLRLHFGAVDWEAEVWCNDQAVGRHRGGFVPFSVDITDAVGEGEEAELTVAVWDPSDEGPQPVGKQSLRPVAIQYTPVAGIWQTVWLEPVPSPCIESVVATTALARHELTVTVTAAGSESGDEAVVRVPGGPAGRAPMIDGTARVLLAFDHLRPWSPTDPHLHDLAVSLERDDTVVDHVDSYAGAREVGVDRDADGHWRLHLNGHPIFHLGLLDQGWWPDGLYTAPTDEALAHDIEITKAMGFNTIRKHVKVEPARWYWHADRLGVLVWQDMPNTRFDLREMLRQMGDGIDHPDMDFGRIAPADDPAGFRAELDAMLDHLAPFPSIVTWVPFNEGWGQHDTDATLAHVAQRDRSRVVDGPSGWVDHGTGALRDHHVYGREATLPEADGERPTVYGEYGGLGLTVAAHNTHADGWGYQQADDAEQLADLYAELTDTIAGLIPQGLAAAIYTQTTDVEAEHNGLLTYDRAVVKIPVERLARMHRRLIES